MHFTYKNTADDYRPLLAGAQLADAFIDSAYSKITSANGKNNPEQLIKVLNFEQEMKDKDQSNLYPLLGKYDQIVRYDSQSSCYDAEQLETIPYSHVTGSIQFKLLREFILDGLQ